MAILEDIALSVENGDEASVGELTQKAVSEGIAAPEILDNGLVAGMNVVGEKFKNNEVFIPEVLSVACPLPFSTVIPPRIALRAARLHRS